MSEEPGSGPGELEPVPGWRRADSVAAAGAVLAAVAVGLGAFGAHGLRETLSPERLATFEIAVRYQMFHALGLLAIASLGVRACRAAPLLLAGSLVFSGSLYLIVFTGAAWWGAVAPVGGLLLIGGWLMLVVLMLRSARAEPGT